MAGKIFKDRSYAVGIYKNSPDFGKDFPSTLLSTVFTQCALREGFDVKVTDTLGSVPVIIFCPVADMDFKEIRRVLNKTGFELHHSTELILSLAQTLRGEDIASAEDPVQQMRKVSIHLSGPN